MSPLDVHTAIVGVSCVVKGPYVVIIDAVLQGFEQDMDSALRRAVEEAIWTVNLALDRD